MSIRTATLTALALAVGASLGCSGGGGPTPRTAYAASREEGPHPSVVEQTEAEIRERPTDSSTALARSYRLAGFARLVLQACGPERVEPAYPPERPGEVAALLDQGRAGEAARLIDDAMLALCRVGRACPRLERIRRVSFPGPTGADVVGYLVVPASPRPAAFVFGHGGFGYKETWVDLLQDVSERTGAWCLSFDFEGCGESGGYSSWSNRIGDFSAAFDSLHREVGVTRFAAGGHSGGGAWPAACASIRDPRVSVLVLWDCIFDFYDTHVADGAPDPGGNPACLVERTLLASRSRIAVPDLVAPSRGVPQHLEEIYEEIDQTLLEFRHPSQMLGEVQRERSLAVLHLVAEDVLRPVGPEPQGEEFTLPAAEAGPVRSRFLGRPLRFLVSGLFDRPPGLAGRWHEDLGEPRRMVVIPGTTHAFTGPGRAQGVDETGRWLEQHLTGAGR